MVDDQGGGGEIAWKDKILDYEIETHAFAFWSHCTLMTWKDKILDYEIETLLPRTA